MSDRRGDLAPRVRVAELPPDVLLTRDEVAAWLVLNPREVQRLGVPCVDLGPKTKRYRKGDVAMWLAEHTRGRAA